MKLNKIDIMLTIMFTTVIAFIVTVFVFAWNDKTVPGELILGFFGLITGEAGALAYIKNHKGDNQNDE